MNIDGQNALVTELQRGSKSAFEEFVLIFSYKIKGVACRLTLDPEAAEDITQSVFIKVFRKIGLFRNESTLSSWVYRIVMNEIFMHFRKTKKNNYQDFADGYWVSSPFYCPENALLCKELNEIMRKSVQKLDEKEMEVLIYRDIEGMSTNEVCKALNVTIPAVKSRLLRGRRKLRKSDLGRYIKRRRGQKDDRIQRIVGDKITTVSN